MKRTNYVLDTSVFIVGTAFSMSDNFYTVPGIVEELRGQYDSQRFEYFQNAGLHIREPSRDSIEKIEELSNETGDSNRLSDVDKSLLALALDLKAILVTDDYSVQNLAAEIGIEYITVAERGIKEIFHWKLKCKGCGRIWEEAHQSCPICGSEVKTVRKMKGG